MLDTKKTPANSAPLGDEPAASTAAVASPTSTADPIPAPPRPLTPEQTKIYEDLVRAGTTVYDACAQARGHRPMKAKD